MIDRRDVLIGGLCIASLAGAEALRPRRKIDLVGDSRLSTIIPEQFGRWRPDPSMGVVTPPTEGSLADRLYREILSRAYMDRPDQPSIMLLVTHGAEQSDALQLHRPETCYPAVGFTVISRALKTVALGANASLPVVHLTAQLADRVEDIVYWTRIGEDFPQTAGEQRNNRLMSSLRGYVGDGILARASAIRSDGKPQHGRVEQFIRDMIVNIDPSRRRALIGTSRSTALT